ncbi:lamin tail domain-containing protein [Labilibaculum sp. DW002]|uniref:Lamin tail domain-containing protein n=1 Tax=Paralabilibaculum antarcticum TaxID=2912572 RepID=A0ABT5VT16_9BACT|nr:lamin tail domain-containing protein [Labilibaculum sp. DW002]MDE5418442.1 lamin tail domain-containing protein [Labilibaculum sp. DW002]
MKKTLCVKLFLMVFLLNSSWLYAEDVWRDNFAEETGKGYWGGGSDMAGIIDWTLSTENCSLTDESDYIKVISTSGGRLEAKDCDGEAIWKTFSIDISTFTDVEISLYVAETGSSTNANKYIKCFYKLDGGDEVPFETNPENIGNWGNTTVSQGELNGSNLQVLVKMNNPNAGDAVYIKDVLISGKPIIPESDKLTQILASQSPIEKINIETTINEPSVAVPFFRFKIEETAEVTDDLPTKISNMAFYNSNPENGMNWNNNIGGIHLFSEENEIVPNIVQHDADSIWMEFLEGQINIPNATSREFELRVYLDTTNPIVDGKNFELYIKESALGFKTFDSGSGFSSQSNKLSSEIHLIDVSASRICFTNLQDTIIRNHQFSISLKAVDNFDNLDVDAEEEVSLSLKNGSGVLESKNEINQLFVKGEICFDSLQYSEVETINLSAKGNVLGEWISNNIVVKNTRQTYVAVDSSYANNRDFSSLRVEQEDALEVYRFTIIDSGQDSLSTILKNIRLIGSDKNQVNWEKSIEKFIIKRDNEVLDGVLDVDDSELTIQFSESEIGREVASELTAAYSILCYLKKGKTIDGEIFQMAIDSLHTQWEVSDKGSGLLPIFESNLLGPEFTLNVEPENMNFTDVPKFINFQEQFELGIELIDRFGNVDSDFDSEIRLSLATGNGEFLSENFNAIKKEVKYVWSDLVYSMAEIFTIQVECDYFPTILSDNISAVDRTSMISSADAIESLELNPLAIDQQNAIAIFSFQIADLGSHDQLSTSLSNLKFYNSYPENYFNWKKHIAGAVLKSSGELIATTNDIEEDYIRFSSSQGVVEVGNGLSKNLTLEIFFRKGNLSDLATLQVEIPSEDHEWKTLENSSALSSEMPKLSSSVYQIQVQASKYAFLAAPFAIVGSQDKFSLRIGACDTHGNIDVDAQEDVNLILDNEIGELLLSEEVKGLENGIAVFDSIQYTGNDNFQIIIDANLVSDTAKIFLGEDELKISDDFETGNLNLWQNTDAWKASSYQAINGDYSLKHNLSSEIGSSHISIPLTDLKPNSGVIQWSFIIRNGDWDPSAGNQFVFHLLMDNSDPEKLTEKYSVGVNLQGSKDLLSFWNANKDEDLKLLFESDLNWNENESIAIQVNYFPEGRWELAYNRLGELDNWLRAGQFYSEVNDTSADWFSGLDFSFESSSRAGYLWFDDLKIKAINTAPFLKFHHLIGQDSIKLIYSEDLDFESLVNKENFIVKRNEQSLSSFDVNKGDANNELILKFEEALLTGEYSFEILNICDLKGAVRDKETFHLNYFAPAKEYDIVINEIMADENPSVGLPEYEYLELYNTTEYPISVEDWKLKVGSKTVILGKDSIPAFEYLLLCSTTAAEQFSEYGNVLGVTSFPGLTNSGTSIEIQSAEEVLIDRVVYSDSWYQDEFKSDGGWSLERIDPLNTCSRNGNWAASESGDCGTPGAENSIYKNNPDNIAPKISEFSILSRLDVLLSLSEYVDTLILKNTDNYTFANNSVSSIELLTSDQLKINFSNPFEDGVNQNLSISGLKDECDNALDTILNFTWHEVHPNDIVINEIMADENPSVGLPEFEYIELYNNTSHSVSIRNWTLKINGKHLHIDAVTVEADSYLILCSNSAVDLFKNYGNVSGLTGFSGLTNSEGTITIESSENVMLDHIQYFSAWHQTVEKENGGWSLERIDPNNTAWQQNNWSSSMDESGGTPGKLNSIDSVNIDLDPPLVLTCNLRYEDCLELVFSEPMDEQSMHDLANFELSDNTSIDKIEQQDSNPLEYHLFCSETLSVNQQYELIISEKVKDLGGNSLEITQYAFWVADEIAEGDVIINEVLFNPYPNGSDYVEIVNVSDKIIDLKDVKLGTRDENYQLMDTLPFSMEYLHPKEYFLITDDTLNVSKNYFTTNSNVFCQAKSLPSFNDEKGRVVLSSKEVIIDDFEYNEEMHFALLASLNGVALERVDPFVETNKESNWQSAAQNIGFGSPGMQNSVFQEAALQTTEVSLSSEVFSPDNDGINDRLMINFKLKEDGYLASIRIYNSLGVEVRKLATNVNLANEDTLFWDGLSSNKMRTPIGVYLVYIELFNLEGDVSSFKLPCVLGGKFK